MVSKCCPVKRSKMDRITRHASDLIRDCWMDGWMDGEENQKRNGAAEEKVQLIIRNHTNATKSDEMFIDQTRINNLCMLF